MLYFEHKNDDKNIGSKTGKRFVAVFEIKSFVLREDGTKELVKEDATLDLLSFLRDEKRELTMYVGTGKK